MPSRTLARVAVLATLATGPLALTVPGPAASSTGARVAAPVVTAPAARVAGGKHQFRVGVVNDSVDRELTYKDDARAYLPKYGGPTHRLLGNAWIVNDADYVRVDRQFFYVEDEDADGMRVGLRWRTGDREQGGLCVHRSGKDGRNGDQGLQGVGCTFRVPEGKRVRYRLGVCDSDAHPCGTAKNWWTKLDSWSWTTLHQPPKAVHGWWDYTDDADGEATADDCDEAMTSTDC